MSLTLTDVSLTYADGEDRVLALDRVNLDVPPGTVTAVLGPSGSGKSSLLAVAATLITPDSGTVVIADADTAGMSRDHLAELRRRRIGIVFQQPNLVPSLTAVEQLQVMAWIDGRPLGRAVSDAMTLLDSVGMADQADRRPHSLSGGQRQRVNIARALMNEPTVLLVDEPTSALDQERGMAIVELITRLTRERATSTVLVTHDRAHLAGADRVAEVHDGRLSILPDAAAARGASLGQKTSRIREV
ncbi:ABC transporter ATP-binding protein [Rhodococcus sp. NPDC047139]|uniref:ABC transporter ATP-binding protein n=1 Tax=Rhodococcus sp. NPDC047139 TaxID=3155141 RepID=UPI0033D47D49